MIKEGDVFSLAEACLYLVFAVRRMGGTNVVELPGSTASSLAPSRGISRVECS